jgi:hypothetical protein
MSFSVVRTLRRVGVGGDRRASSSFVVGGTSPHKSPRGLWMSYQSVLGYVSMQADRVGPYQPQVPGAEFGSGVRYRLALTSGLQINFRPWYKS